jgi:hypothetical protein
MLKLYTYRYWHPTYHEFCTLDCVADTPDAALASAQRFLKRENRRMVKAKVERRVQVPYHVSWIKEEKVA